MRINAWLCVTSIRRKSIRSFCPTLERINRLPFVVSEQCCAGHIKYTMDAQYRPENESGQWGYLQLMMYHDTAVWLHEHRIGDWGWLWARGSQMWMIWPKNLP